MLTRVVAGMRASGAVKGRGGMTPQEMMRRAAKATDERTAAILNLARNIVVQRGELSDTEFRAARTAGLTDAEIVETVANVALNIFSNYVNHVARTVVDFPEVKPVEVETPAEACSTGCGCGH